MFESLKEMGATPDIIEEFKSQTKNKAKGLEILDVNTLIGLEKMEDVFQSEKHMKEYLKFKRKQSN